MSAKSYRESDLSSGWQESCDASGKAIAEGVHHMKEDKDHIFIVGSDDGCHDVVETLFDSPGFTVHMFDSSHDCLEALLWEEAKCNLVLMCLRLFPSAGLEIIKEVRRMRPSVPIIVLASPGNAVLAFRALKLGAYDYMEKPINTEYLISSVRNAIASHPMEHLPVKSLLSKIEYEVLAHMLKGESTKQIALNRNRSIRTIEDHRSSIMKKLKVDNVVDLVKRAAYVVMPAE